MNALKHFKTITAHKLLVMKYCFKIGLYKQGLLHDLSKYSLTEFRVGCKYYQGDRSPNNAEREAIGYSSAWLNHKGKNKHHNEYWIDYSLNRGAVMAAVKMPKKYVAEMLMDRICASRVYLKKGYTDRAPLEYYLASKRHIIMHEETKAILEFLLRKLADEGEDTLLRYMRKEFLKSEEYLEEVRG